MKTIDVTLTETDHTYTTGDYRILKEVINGNDSITLTYEFRINSSFSLNNDWRYSLMKKAIAMIFTVLIVFGGAVSTVYAIDNTQISSRIVSLGYINGTNVNLRANPGTSSASLGQLGNGDTLEDCMVDEVGIGDYVWIKVKMTSGVHAGKTGWVAWNYIKWTGSRED